MPTLDEIQQQIKSLDGVSKFFGRREIKELPAILWQDEAVERIVQGLYNNGNGLLVGTNKRLIFVDKGVFKLRVEDFPYDKLTSIQYETGLMFGEITIFASGNKAVIKNIEKQQVRNFAEGVRAKISSGGNAKSEAAPASDDSIVQLERLAQLKAAGILTEEEFAAKKRQILGL
ncbi:PH domain-containing protein [Paenibacillus thailandensis]|uniref:PH domain-containing protein n=1 Tax=Paenibacillus thailandensis TaxID=393250 RepID=A0ABW5QYL6_9BACL